MNIKNRLFFLLFFFFILVKGSLFASQYDNMPIEKIEINIKSVDSKVNKEAVKAKLETKQKARFSQQEFDNDLKKLAEEFDRVESSFRIENNQLILQFNLWVKPIIRAITFNNNDNISTKKLRKELAIETGSEFDRELFLTAFNKLKSLYIKKGYFKAQISYKIIPLSEKNEIDIQITVEEGVSGKIEKLEFIGFTSHEEDEVTDLMVTKCYNLFLSVISQRGCYHPDMIEHDKMTLVNFFQDKGYADAKIDIAVTPSEKKDRIILTITLEKGKQYRIGAITIEGNSLFDSEFIMNAINCKENYAYSPEALRLSVQSITNLYGSKGYIDTTVDMALNLRETGSVYDIHIIIDEAEQHYVGLVKVFGNTYTHNRVILHESLLCPGELFDNRRLEGTERRIANTGLFGSVNVYAVESQLENDENECSYRDVFIEVEESDTGNIGLFCGFSSLDRIFGGIELTERNFNLMGLTRLVQNGPGALRGGGEFTHAKVNVGDKQTAYTLQWTKPYFLDTPWFLGVDLEKSNNRALSEGYTIKTYGGNIHGTYIWNNFLKYDIHYRARHSGLSVKDSANVGLEEQEKNTGFISGVGASFIYDSTDHPRRPTCGLRSRFLYELLGLGGNFQFMKWSYINSYYYPISSKGTLKFRADCNFIHTYKTTLPLTLPMSERLFVGGDTTVRGYRPYIIGPKIGNNEPLGGVSSYLLSEEYQHTLLRAPSLDGFFFVDAGYLSLQEFSIGQCAASVGFGIRVEVMRGMPMTFGAGWPIHPVEIVDGTRYNLTQRFFFSMGGNF